MIVTVRNEPITVRDLYLHQGKFWADAQRTFKIPKSYGFKIVETGTEKKIWVGCEKKYVHCTERIVKEM